MSIYNTLDENNLIKSMLSSINTIISILKIKDTPKTLNLAKSILDEFLVDADRTRELYLYDALGRLYYDVKCYEKSLYCAEQSLVNSKTDEERYSSRCNIIKIKNHMNEPKDALRYIKANLIVKPGDLDMLMEEVFSNFLLNNKKESERILRELLIDKITELDEKTISRIMFNLGTYDLYNGDFQKGLRNFLLQGKEFGIWKKYNIDSNKEVSDFNTLKEGDNLLIVAEGGIGDEFINIRFMNHLRDKGIIATWCTHRDDLVMIFNDNNYNTKLLKDVNFNEYDKICYSMSLPIWLDVKEVELLKYFPYININSDKILKSDKMKIGLRWSGNPLYEQDLHRSVNFEDIYKIAKEKYPKAEFYSLQYPKDEIIDDYDDVIDCVPMIKDYRDTLQIIKDLDFVITSCTSIAHASAMMDKKVFILTPISEYYTWCSPDPKGKNKSIWYGDNVTLCRQAENKSWDSALEDLRNNI